jgi:hypothetical protein
MTAACARTRTENGLATEGVPQPVLSRCRSRLPEPGPVAPLPVERSQPAGTRPRERSR